MTYDPSRHHRRSIRLRGYDYGQAGAYFFTICVQDRACLLGEVVDGEVRLSRAGETVQAAWDGLAVRFQGIETDAFVVMPNHIHGIVFLGTVPDAAAIGDAPSGEKGAMNRAPTTRVSNSAHGASDRDVQGASGRHRTPPVGARFIAPSFPTPTDRVPPPVSQPVSITPALGEIVRTLKAISTRQIRLTASPSFVWQRNYYERIIRHDRELDRARAYITANPTQWSMDAENPASRHG